MSLPLSIGWNTPFNDAIQATVSRGVVLPDVYYGKLQGIHRQFAFSIADVAKVDQLQAVLDSLTHSLNTGGTFANWQRTVDVKALAMPDHRLDNIFRTNIQSAYNSGHWQQQLANKSTRPYLVYDAINDSRTRPSHKANDGIIRKIDDPIWKRIWFSRNVYRCRCRLISLSEEQAIARSKNGTGLQKTETLDPARDTAWDSVDVMNADVMTFGIERAIAKRMTAGKADNRLLSAMNKNPLAPEKAVDAFLKLQEIENITSRLRNKELAQSLGLTEAEHSMIHTYTAIGYNDINRLLHGTLPDWKLEESGEIIKNAAEVLSQALAKLPSKKGVSVRRVKLPDAVLAEYQIGETVTNKAFASATFGDKDVFGTMPVRLKIFGKTGKRIDYFSVAEGELEILFDKGVRFKVKNREEKLLNDFKITEITLEEI
jgi:SPP1 gp7 family putative phage head morphogenesis protein